MKMPPTIMIGAITIRVHDISTSICTCWTSLVSRVIRLGAPKCCTSRCENVPTRWKIARADVAAEAHRRTRAEPDRRRPSRAICTKRDAEHHGADADDVAGVAGDDAVVDDVGVQAGQVERPSRCR